VMTAGQLRSVHALVRDARDRRSHAFSMDSQSRSTRCQSVQCVVDTTRSSISTDTSQPKSRPSAIEQRAECSAQQARGMTTMEPVEHRQASVNCSSSF
jgi:hypothetical protein